MQNRYYVEANRRIMLLNSAISEVEKGTARLITYSGIEVNIRYSIDLCCYSITFSKKFESEIIRILNSKKNSLASSFSIAKQFTKKEEMLTHFKTRRIIRTQIDEKCIYFLRDVKTLTETIKFLTSHTINLQNSANMVQGYPCLIVNKDSYILAIEFKPKPELFFGLQYEKYLSERLLDVFTKFNCLYVEKEFYIQVKIGRSEKLYRQLFEKILST